MVRIDYTCVYDLTLAIRYTYTLLIGNAYGGFTNEIV